jgi:hypothetical protein
MASSGLSTIVDYDDFGRYEGQVRTGTKTKHGRGVFIWKGENSGQQYEGEWLDDTWSGQGVFTWPDGERYEGGFQDDQRSGRGVQWLPGGRVFDGVWAEDRPLQGTAMEPDGALFLAKFDGRYFDWAGKVEL